MEGQRAKPSASRAKKPAAKRTTTEPKRTVAAPSHAGSCVPQRGARSRRAECDGDPKEKPSSRSTRARPGRESARPKDLQPSATRAPEDADQPSIPRPQPLADPEAPLIAKGPSSRRGARSTGPLRAPRASRRELDLTPDQKLRKVLEKLRLKRKEISVAAEVVNGVVKRLLLRMQDRESEFKGVEQLNAGSYYEHVKITAPNEFDVMFKLGVPRIELQEYYDTGAFYLVKFKRNPSGNPLNHFLEGGILSASKMLSKFREIIKEEVNQIKGIDVSVETQKPGSPAVTLLIRNPKEISVDIILALESKGSWPISTKEGLPIKNWLGTKVRTNLRREPFYLVPKNAKDGSGFQGETWRLSFSHTEKYILNNHGIEKTCCESSGVKCCRKECLKLMKYLLEQLKKECQQLDAFCSYHVKTAIFHMWTENPQDSQWDLKNLSTCFDDFLTFFVKCLRKEELTHYFIPKFNLFSRELIDQQSKEFLSKKIEYERNNGFPVFDKF